MDKLSKKELLEKCKELNIIKCLSKNKSELILLINNKLEQLKETQEEQLKETQEEQLKETKEEQLKESESESEPEENKNQTVEYKTIDGNNIKFIDLFCGIGGFHQALKRINAECVFASDIDEKCRKTYELNYHLKPEGDISKVEINKIPSFDILCGGFPCQSFSNSGNKKGLEDKRGKLFEYILKIAEIKKPSFMFLENVKHIKNIDNGNVFKHIIHRINET